MYEEKPKKKIDINWKSLLIKMGLLLVALFLVLWIVSLVNQDKNKVKESNLSSNLQTMKSAAIDYFKGSKLPNNINGKKKITLGEMFDSKLLVEFKDQNNQSCDSINSYAEATKINSSDYTIKVKLVCGAESDYVIQTVSYQNNDVDDNNSTNEPVIDNNTNNNTDDNNSTQTNNTVDNSTNTNSNTSTNNNKKPTTNTTTNKKPNITHVTTNNTNTPKPNTSTNTSTNNNTSNVVASTCPYGNKDYTSNFPLAYVIPGNCAASMSDYYKAEYANAVSSITAAEYRKLNDEMVALSKKTGAKLILDTPIYSGIYNKSNKGLVGYQVLFTMKQRVNYSLYTVYQYYLDQNGNRVAVIDKRNSIPVTNSSNNNNSSNTNNNSNNNNNTSTTVRVQSIRLNRSSVSLYEGDTYSLSVTINPTNATNKTVTWKSSNTLVAKVSSSGVVTGRNAGTATITAAVDGKSASIKVYVKEEESYRYCSTRTERVYSTGYIDLNTINSSRTYRKTYQVALDTKYTDVYDVEYGNITANSEYLNAYNYWKNKNKPLSLVNGSTGGGIDAGSYSKLRESSLKEENFVPSVSYTKRVGNTLYFDISYRLKNLNSIQYAKPFYTSANYGIYFLPLYFDVITIDYQDCVNVKESDVSRYQNGYVRIN